MKQQSKDTNIFTISSINKSKQSTTYHQHKPKRLVKSNEKAERSSQISQINARRFETIERKLQKKIFQEDVDEKNKRKNLKTEKPIITVDREIQLICQVLKYFFGEYKNENKPSYCDDYYTCEDWQIEEIMKQIQDTNLGDFIIKCPNPDNISEELKELYNITEEDEKPFKLNASQAMEFYYDLFDIESNARLQSERENIAFMLAFYFLKYPTVVQQNESTDQTKVIDTFINTYNFYKLVESKRLIDYLTMRQQEGFRQKYEAVIISLFIDEFSVIQSVKENKSYSAVDQQAWRALKRSMYWNLNKHLIKCFTKANPQIKQDDDEQSTANNQKQDNQFGLLIGKIKNLSQLLKTFPQLMQKVLKKVKENSHRQYRILFGGQFLKKTIIGQNVIWANTKTRPADVTTLLRMCLLYKLVVKSKLFVRSFLAKDEEHIMIVVKSSEQILENYAQKAHISMEVDLGASDLFSFEPVDHYLRPLRMHSYIRDLQFREKYGIKASGKMNAEEEEQTLKSIESEAINIFKKVEVMNEDQLRTRIIMDQFQADKIYNWISNKLNIDYINQKVLVNEYNTKNPSRRTWQLYYVYNKMIVAFTKRCQQLYNVNKKAKQYLNELDGNIGMLLRLMFLKALNTCNELFYNHRQARSVIPIEVSNLWTSKTKLKNIWNYMGIQSPSGFCTYRKIKSNQKLWRKFQINQLKDRSKFFPSERLIITNKVIYDCVNLGKSLQKKHIISYYPLHDPFILKNIEIKPYIATIKKNRKNYKKQYEGLDPSIINKLYSQYECELTKSDFTKMSIQQKLAFKFGQFKSFSAESVRYYCGQKIAFYFQFMKFLAMKAFPFLLLAVIIQIFLWKEQTDILSRGESNLTSFNNVLIFIFTFVNLFWTTNLVQKWKQEQRRLSQTYGVSQLTEFYSKRVRFQGSFKRNFQTDELNFQYVPKWKTILKTLFTLILNLVYVLLVAQVILLIFLLKTYLFQLGLNQTLVNTAPSILMAVASQIFNSVYMIIIRNITVFENHKTVSDYEGSLVSKASLITFVINFYSIFIFAFFSGYLSSSFICQIRTTKTLQKINNCDYFVSQQLLSFVMVDMAVTIVGALLPFVMFKVNQWLQNRKKGNHAKFSVNFFESIDQFYQEQDQMQSYMFNDELDMSWQGYMKIINVFAATALFAPALPFAYVMMFIAGIIRLHASKYEVIYLKRRVLPLKANSINWWLMIVEAISFISIITNIAYMIYTRQVFSSDRGRIFFLFIIMFFAFKYYLLSQYGTENNEMAIRNEIKTSDILIGKRKNKYNNISQQVNTDIENVYYDETLLNRKFHNLKKANLKFNKKQV